MRGLDLLQAYSLGTQKAWDVLDWLVKYPQIKVGTFYTLSLENLDRSQVELSALFRIFDHELEKIRQKTVFAENDIALKFVGDLSKFPKALQDKMHTAEQLTENFKARTIYLALGYNGQNEILRAAKQLARDYRYEQVDIEKVDENSFKKYLYSDFGNPDMILRTSGTQRLSGFLTYQSAYSELYFTEKLWPELSEQDLAKAIAEYESRDRKFGK
jgi:undecaprenyl diphosphate synthase